MPLVETLVHLAIAGILLGLVLPGLTRGGPGAWPGWPCLLGAAGIMLFSVASVLARLLLAVLRWLLRE